MLANHMARITVNSASKSLSSYLIPSHSVLIPTSNQLQEFPYLFSGCCFHQWRSTKEDCSVAFDNDGLICHCRDICTTSGARPEYSSDLT